MSRVGPCWRLLLELLGRVRLVRPSGKAMTARLAPTVGGRAQAAQHEPAAERRATRPRGQSATWTRGARSWAPHGHRAGRWPWSGACGRPHEHGPPTRARGSSYDGGWPTRRRALRPPLPAAARPPRGPSAAASRTPRPASASSGRASPRSCGSTRSERPSSSAPRLVRSSPWRAAPARAPPRGCSGSARVEDRTFGVRVGFGALSVASGRVVVW